MADKKPEAGEGEAAPPKKKGKLLLFIIIGVLVVVFGAGAAFFLLKKKNHAADEEEGDEPTTKSEKAKKSKNDNPEAPPVFVKLEPFTVKLQTEQQEAYLQATPELRVLDAPIGDKVKQYTPEIRHKVLLLMSGKKASDLSTPQGVQRLSNEIRVQINLIIDGPKAKVKTKGKAKEEAPAAEPTDQAAADDSVQAVLFTSFIIQ
ncbi:MAG: flagellar basal body-associated FliL family protein [Rhodocyclaceae bacterium]|nr:flagellar basal body-associated FliL family protein [Rhodocyclaceae bacterium]